MRRTILAITLLALATGVAADEGDLSLRIYDISAICAPRISQFGPRLGSTPSNHEEQEMEEVEPRAFLDPDMLAEMIRQHVEPESWDEDSAEIQTRRTWLYVRNQVHVLKKVEAALADISQAASRRVRFEVSVHAMKTTGGISTVAGKPFVPDERAVLLESGSVETYPGIRTTFKITNRLRLLKDFDVEIAENSAIADPIVEAADEGFVIDLVPHPTLNGSQIMVEALVRQGSFERPIPRLKLSETRKTLLGALDLPVFLQAYAHSTAVVASGGEFSVPFLVDGKLLMVVVKAKLLGRGGGDWLMDVGALTREQKRYLVGYNPDAEEMYRNRTAPELRFLYEEGFRPVGDIEELGDVIYNLVDSWYWDEEGSMEYMQGGLLVVRAKPEVRARVVRFVTARENEALKPLRVDVEVVSVTGKIESAVVDASPAGFVRTAASLRTVPGKEASVLLGRTRNFVVDYDVEVAQSSKIADPIVGQSFTGLAANVLPRLSTDGGTVRLDLGILLAYQGEKGEKTSDPGADFLGTLEQVPENRRVFNTTLEFPLGKVYVFDGGPDPMDPNRRLAITVAVTAQ